LLGTPRVGTQHTNRREAAGARHQQLDLAQLGQQMPSVRAVAPVGHVKRGHAIEVIVDRLVHLPGENSGDRLAAKTAVTFAPFQTLRLHALHQLKCSR
jgi:radical SAM superfamily enzyme